MKPEERLSRTVHTRLTKAEARKLERAAKGEPLGTFLRRIILRYLARRRK